VARAAADASAASRNFFIIRALQSMLRLHIYAADTG
jgi:hypothetical protein